VTRVARSDVRGSDEAPSSRADGADAEAAASDAEPAADEAGLDPWTCPEHGRVHPDERPWLPKLEDGDLAPHQVCPDCGEVEGRGRRSGLDRGGLVNRISRLEEMLDRDGYVFTEAQKRVIFKRIEERDLDDGYGFTRERQLDEVAEVVGDVIGLPRNVVDSYLRHT
jgi:hypothetical protein